MAEITSTDFLMASNRFTGAVNHIQTFSDNSLRNANLTPRCRFVQVGNSSGRDGAPTRKFELLLGIVILEVHNLRER